VRTYIALGANLGADPAAALDDAERRLATAGLVRVLRRSRNYRSRPVGPSDQPMYVNSAIEAETELDPFALLDHLKSVEADMGRTPSVRWGPRVIDLDILLYGSAVVTTERLEIPHREMRRRRFVLAPLADLSPGLEIPGLGRTVADCLAALGGDPGDVEHFP
jgi:2-amino-4-hydroxy-6-hydroxymethyldihydropteridine diphosphokinase